MTTELISKDALGTIGDAQSRLPLISADARYVAFLSDATNVAPGDTNGRTDAFVHDRQTGAVERISLDANGAQLALAVTNVTVSPDGQFAIFEAAGNVTGAETIGHTNIYLVDRNTHIITRVDNSMTGGEPNSTASFAQFSGNGRFIAYSSTASDIIAGDTNGRLDTFVLDRQTGITERVSVFSDGSQLDRESQLQSISPDGRYVATASFATQLLAGSGAVVGLFLYDRDLHTVQRIDVGPNGPGNRVSSNASISDDGRYATFFSTAPSLVPGEATFNPHVYLRDMLTGSLERIDLLALNAAPAYNSNPAISGDGRFVAYTSDQPYDPNDTNGVYDVYVYDRILRTTTLVSRGPDGSLGDGNSANTSISSDGRFIGINSLANNWVPGDGATADFDVFLIDRAVATATNGDDFLYGSANVDFISGLDGNDSLYGGEGGDGLHGQAGNDVIYGGNGDDVGVGLSGNDFLFGGAGNDTLIGDDGADSLYGGDGIDQLFGYGDGDVLYGGAEGDFLSGGDGNDTLYGDDGDDAIHGEGGDDTAFGGAGNDVLVGYDGNDTLNGDAGNDTIIGNAGSDTLNGGDGNDQMFGYEDTDTMSGGLGDDFLAGGSGNDVLHGNEGGDVLDGEADDDQLFGDAGGDNLNGNTGNDQLFGGDGNDGLLGWDGDDVLDGGPGNDFLIGDRADGTGARGNDTFVFHDGAGNDNIADFQGGAGTTVGVGDVIDIRDFHFADFTAVLAAATNLPSGTYIQLDTDDAIFLEGFAKANLAADDFLLA